MLIVVINFNQSYYETDTVTVTLSQPSPAPFQVTFDIRNFTTGKQLVGLFYTCHVQVMYLQLERIILEASKLLMYQLQHLHSHLI